MLSALAYERTRKNKTNTDKCVFGVLLFRFCATPDVAKVAVFLFLVSMLVWATPSFKMP